MNKEILVVKVGNNEFPASEENINAVRASVVKQIEDAGLNVGVIAVTHASDVYQIGISDGVEGSGAIPDHILIALLDRDVITKEELRTRLNLDAE